ncbi:YopT-type cysteine protease domain-containing protein [Pelagibius sp. Alg239-R121]|uniref:YopT-type cysteine protease domain-containing protein n=1 Tax=Pelagibius sp. Alg239-R121 TaxID=2993448 RepID=UPI0024A65D7A|nr:YopT-type cysteine protease domain-containing protein [Pelagibius sp. Alg239-R121]
MLSVDDFECMEALAASHGGSLKQRYDQDSDEHSRAGGILDNGWCLGVAVNWIGRTRDNKSFWPWLETAEGQAACVNIMVSQKLLGSLIRVSTGERETSDNVGALVSKAKANSKTLQSEQITLATKELKKRYELEPDRSNSLAGCTFAEGQLASSFNLAVELCKINNYALIGTTNAQGGHAMAVAMNPVRFMDPNVGEFEFSDVDRVGDWLQDHFKHMASLNFDTYDELKLYCISYF